MDALPRQFRSRLVVAVFLFGGVSFAQDFSIRPTWNVSTLSAFRSWLRGLTGTAQPHRPQTAASRMRTALRSPKPPSSPSRSCTTIRQGSSPVRRDLFSQAPSFANSAAGFEYRQSAKLLASIALTDYVSGTKTNAFVVDAVKRASKNHDVFLRGGDGA
jgi:hypothetical protein